MLVIEGILAELRLSKTWLAEVLGVSSTQVSRLLAGERRWTEENRAKVGAALGWPEEQRGRLFEKVDDGASDGTGVGRVVLGARFARAQGHITEQELEIVEQVFGGGEGEDVSVYVAERD